MDSESGAAAWTAEQLDAIERRQGDLLLDAGAGSGKTSVLVERFARAVIEDGVAVAAILTITFTEKAAAELRDRIRARLRDLGAHEAARETEGAFISTIHGFCARVLRAHALAAGIDPAFVVLDELQATRLKDAAFDEALDELAKDVPGIVDLIAAYGAWPLRGAILRLHAELRSRGQIAPGLPPLGAPPDLEEARARLSQVATAAARELGALGDPPARVIEALDRLERLERALAHGEPWPGELRALSLPGGNGAALSTPACAAYAEALDAFRVACEYGRAQTVRELLDRLLRRFGERYAEHKRACSGVDFEDLELMTRELLAARGELRERYAERFEQIMVDELQDTNQVQLELIELIARDNLFTVGDAQQSIYAFRHADVELFERRGQRLAQVGARSTLQTNFRSRREILHVLNSAFADQLGERFKALRAGRIDAVDDDGEAAGRGLEPRVELLVADKGADWASSDEGLAAPWRLAEARALADRVRQLIDEGWAAHQVVLLLRATTDMRAYERALEEQGVPTYVIGGRGYWSHPQVLDLVSYLRILANPRDEEALYAVLASPLVGASLDALVVLASGARHAGRDPWWLLQDPEGRLDELSEQDRHRLAEFALWFAAERLVAARADVERLIDRVLERTGYDLQMLAMPGGPRRLANVSKLMRLAREYESSYGRDLRGFLELVRGRTAGWSPDPRESEAPVEGEALDAVRLMTIHRAKGLEFDVVCVADLGRAPRRPLELIRVGRDGRLGLRLSEPGTGKAEPALDYVELGEEQLEDEAREERRLFYVAMTRAKERLILSGASKLDPWPTNTSGSPMAWIGPALVGDIAERIAEGSGVTEEGVRFTFVHPPEEDEDGVGGVAPRPSAAPAPSAGSAPSAGPPPLELEEPPTLDPPPPADPPPPVAALSYSSLGEYARCGYRFYVERVLRMPAVGERGVARAPADAVAGAAGLSPIERGLLAHALLERLDFRRPVAPDTAAVVAASGEVAGAEDAAQIATLVRAFAESELCARLASARTVRREERFAFLLEPGGVLIGGAFDVLARERDGTVLIVDYKSDRLEAEEPGAVVERAYSIQQLVYALAALRSGAEQVEVLHVFLEDPGRPVSRGFAATDMAALEQQLGALARRVFERDFRVTESPHRAVCNGCPAEGGLCSWPLAMTRREAADTLF